MKKKFTILIAAAVMLLTMINLPTKVWGQNYTLVSALNGITSGDTYCIAALDGGKYYTVPNTTINGQTFTCTEATYSNEILTPASGHGEFIFTAVSGVNNAYYIYNTNLKKYLVATASKKFGYVESNSSDYGYWTFSTVASGGFSGLFSIQHNNKNHYMRAYSNSVRCYDGANNNGIYLFVQMNDPTWAISPSSHNFGSSITAGSSNLQQSFTVTTENLEHDVTVSFGTNDACYEKNVSTIMSNATSTDITITFKPTVIGTHNNTLVLSSDDFDENIIVDLSATVLCAPAVNPLAFDDVNLVLNGANVSTQLSQNTGTGNGGPITYVIKTNQGGAGSLDGNTFTATAVGEYVVTATQELNDIYCSETADINIHVVGTDPVCTIDEEIYDFGEVGVGFSKPQDFTITTLNLTEEIALSISDDRYLLSQNTIDEDGTTTVTITFTPDAVGVFEADLTISGSGFDNELLATISGTGVQTYTVSFNPGNSGTGPDAVTNVESYPITLANATASTACQEDAGWTTFAGWTTATTLANENTAPTPLYSAGSTYNIPNGGATLNAVYSQSNENNGSVTFSESGYEDGAEVTEATIDSNVSVSFNKGTNNNNVPKYYRTGTAIRCYSGNCFTVSSTSGNLTTINLSFGTGDGSNTITTNVGTYNGGSWSGTASSVTFTIGGTNGHRRIAGIVVTYGGSTSYAIVPSCIPQVKTPTFSVEGGFYTEEQSVSISCETTGATIKYTLDGTTPSASNGFVYSNAISVAQTTTIKAIAILENYDDSEVATATYTINNAAHPYTVAEARDAIDAGFGLTEVYATGIVSTAGTELSEGKITYSISDDGNATNELQAYLGKNLDNAGFSSLDDIKVGDFVVIYGTLKKFNDIYEFQSGNYLCSITHAPTIIVSQTAVSDMVSIVGLEGATDTENWSNVQSFIVSGSNLTNNITLTLSSTDDFEMSTNGSTYSTNSIQLNKDGDGYVEATTIYVRLKAGATAPVAQKTATITIASEEASSKSVALTGSVAYATLTYNGNDSDGGTLPTDGNSYTYNSEVTVADATMTRTGYDFVCWNTQLDGQGTNSYDPEETFNITASTTLYAQWVAKNYNIAKATMVGGSVAVKVDDSEVFQAGTGSVVTLVVTPASNYTLATLTVNAGAIALSPTVSPSEFNYTFTMPANDVTVAATFTKDPYTWNLSTASYNTPTSKDQVTWHSAYADMVVDKDKSETAANNYLGGDANNRTSSRFYTSSVLTITPANNYKINSVVFTATSAGYATALQESTWTNATAVADNTTVTITPTDGTTAVSATIGGTCGFTEVKVYYEFYIPVNGSSEMTGDVTIPEGEIFAVTSTIKIIDGQTLTVNGTLINTNAANLIIEDGGQLILPDDASVQATVKNSTAASTDTKTYDIQWNAISSPVDNVVVTSFVKGDTHNVYRYDEKTVYWQEYRGTNGFNNLQNGRGYIYRSTESGIEFQGEVITGTVSCADYLSYACDNNRYIGFNLIGNPFTHDITWSNLTTKTNISSAGFFLLGADGNWSAQTTSGTIAPMQAFLVQATEGSPVINISNTAGKGDDRYGNDQIQFTVNNSEYSDVAYAIFREGHGLNKIEHRNDNIPMLYIINDDKDYAIAEMPDNTNVINLGFKARAIGQYTLSLNAEGRYSYMHLYDKLTGSDVDMLLDNSYTFVGSPSDRNDRFVLRLNYNAGNIDTESDIFAYQNGADIIISGTGELQIFDIMGYQVSTQRINGVETINVSTQGVYILRLVGTEIKTQKIVVR